MLGISVEELAKALGLSDATLRRFEKGQGQPLRATATAIQALLEARGAEFGSDGWVRVKPATKPKSR